MDQDLTVALTLALALTLNHKPEPGRARGLCELQDVAHDDRHHRAIERRKRRVRRRPHRRARTRRQRRRRRRRGLGGSPGDRGVDDDVDEEHEGGAQLQAVERSQREVLQHNDVERRRLPDRR